MPNVSKPQLDTSIYIIMKKDVMPRVTNYHILLNKKYLTEDSITVFVKHFREEYCVGQSNIEIYDSDQIIDLIEKYPLEGNDYVKYADHFVAISPFDAPSTIWMYPFQDEQYKMYGGKNWKKK